MWNYKCCHCYELGSQIQFLIDVGRFSVPQNVCRLLELIKPPVQSAPGAVFFSYVGYSVKLPFSSVWHCLRIRAASFLHAFQHGIGILSLFYSQFITFPTYVVGDLHEIRCQGSPQHKNKGMKLVVFKGYDIHILTIL